MIQLNSVAATRLALAAAEAFAAQGHGTIVNMGSVTSLLPERFNGVYAATKAYLLTLSQSLAQELAPRGVRVQAVLPGVTRTPIWEHSGMAAESLPAEMIMEVVDAALAGLDQGETVTIPSLPDAAEWDAYSAQRLALGPNLSHSRPAARYGIAVVS
jgi:short-subunit dehydrogenase